MLYVLRLPGGDSRAKRATSPGRRHLCHDEPGIRRQVLLRNMDVTPRVGIWNPGIEFKCLSGYGAMYSDADVAIRYCTHSCGL